MEIIAFFIFTLYISNACCGLTTDCYGSKPGELFQQWPENQLSPTFCQSQWYGRSWCVDSKDTCANNGGQPSDMGSYDPGTNYTNGCDAKNPICCWNDYIYCTATSLTGVNKQGNCMLHSYCPSASVAPIPSPEYHGCSDGPNNPVTNPDLICCIDVDRPNYYQPCVNGYDDLFDRFFANNVAHGITTNKMTNFLPYFAVYYKYLNDSAYWWENQACYAANYMVISALTLEQFADPTKTFATIIANIKKGIYPDRLISNLQNLIEGDGLITPEIFGKFMAALWQGLPLSGLGGNCADYQKSTKLIFGTSFPCDDVWRQLMTNFDCPPTW